MPEDIIETVVTQPTAPIAATQKVVLQNGEDEKVYPHTYVKSLRDENKDLRLKGKAAEAKLKTLLGLKDDEDIDDAKITAYQNNLTKAQNDAIAKANARLITAEIKSQDGYDVKLVERLLDKSKLTIGDDGSVTGLKEALTALEAEFPQIKIGTPATPGVNPPNPQLGERETLIAQYNDAEKRKDIVSMTAIAAKIKALKK